MHSEVHGRWSMVSPLRNRRFESHIRRESYSWYRNVLPGGQPGFYSLARARFFSCPQRPDFLNGFLVVLMRDTFVHLFVIDLVTLVNGSNYKISSFVVFFYLVLLPLSLKSSYSSYPFSNTFNQCFSPGEVSSPNRTNSNQNYSFVYFNLGGKTEGSEPNGSKNSPNLIRSLIWAGINC